MSFIPLLLRYWKEALILILSVALFGSIRSCKSVQESFANSRTQQEALAENAKRESEAKQAHDQQEYTEAKQSYEKQIRDLTADTRVAHTQCVRNPDSRPVSAPASAPTGAIADRPADVPPAVTFDPGPDLDALTRECDALAVRHAALVEWVNGTR